MNAILKFALFVATVSAVRSGIATRNKGKSFNPFLSALPLVKNSALAKSSGNKCDEDQFMFCTQNFAKALNLTEMPSDAEQFLAYIQQYITSQGLSGFESFCKVTNDFLACIGDNFDSCLSVQNLIYIGLDYDDAMIYATIAAQLKYECGPAYEVIVDHFDCATADSISKIDQINFCIQQFNNSIYSDPTKICQELQTFDACYQDLYLNCGADFDTIICGVLQAAYSISLPQCTITCLDEEMLKLKGKSSLLQHQKN